MNFRTLTLATVALAVLAPAAIAGSYDNCQDRDRAGNGGMICMQDQTSSDTSTKALKVAGEDQMAKKPAYLLDTWPGKSTR